MVQMTPRAWGLLGMLSLLWGGSFFFIALAVDTLPVLTIVWVRVTLGAAILWGVLLVAGPKIVWRRESVLACIGMGLLNNMIPFSLIVYGQGQIASGLASILNATTPLFTVIAAHVLTRDDKLTSRALAGIVLGLAGVATLVGPKGLSGFAGASANTGATLGMIAVLGAAMFYGISGVWARRFKGLGLPPLGIAAGQLTASTAFLLPMVAWIDTPWRLPMPGMTPILAVLALAVLSTALAYVLFFRILALAGPTNLSTVTFLIPITAGLLGWLFLGERLGPAEGAGAALIGLGLAAMDGRPAHWVRRRVRAQFGLV